MLRWEAVSDAAPDLAIAIREHFEGRRHKVLATLRRDGSPRLTGIETTFSDGEVWLGFMPGSRKGTDLLRDPRCSLLSQGRDPDDQDPSAWQGDARIDGHAIEVAEPMLLERFREGQAVMPPGSFELFRVEVTGLSVVHVGDPADHLIVEVWDEAQGYRRVKRV